jgi:hypothetical protein
VANALPKKYQECKEIKLHFQLCAGNTGLAVFRHGPLKLRTVHLSDNTIIYESKVFVQNVFPLFKGTIMSRPHTKFQINSSFQ